MKKQFIAAAIVAMLGLTACGEAKTSEKTSKKTNEAATTAETTEADETEVVIIEELTTDPVKVTSLPTGLSDKYADLDNRSFIYDGHLYTLGVSTLQDMLDNGVEFTKTDNYDKIWTKQLKGQANYGTFDCTVANSRLQFTFGNPKKTEIPMKDCVICQVIYPDFESAIKRGDNDTKLQFAFPYTLTKDELIANSGEPTDKGNHNEVMYTVVSEAYPEYNSGYKFDFNPDGQISFVEIEWIP
ncbi:hypothetical protein [Ruminococcus flavefaciens]|uniref:Lipoprotein n=1 Tax=Ruminococcus flavefaciens TaxID=1265 RepID=A0A1M7M495_RUMFL|nr:hypothetical protein [Ruminococcus flavefaciens]SHM85504.1 hypothetical protein SAMN04487860_11852 [Ruminococcus flavefaciens]